MTNLLLAFRYAARALLRWRGGALLACATLAVGIGSATALYALARIATADLPAVPQLDRLGRIYAASDTLGVERSRVTLAEFDSTLSRTTAFGAISAYVETDVTAGTGMDARSTTAGYVSAAFFRTLGVAPAAGRVLAESDVDAAEPVAVISEAMWRRDFPAGEVGRERLTIDGIPRVVIGVMPLAFRYPFVGITADVWLPLGRAERARPAIVTVFARLRDGVGWAAAQAELASLAAGKGPWSWKDIPLARDVRRRTVSAYSVAFVPAVIVLLVVSVNVACMLLARGLARHHEMSVLRAIGATRAQIVRLLVAEHALLALTGGGAGVLLARGLLRFVASRPGFVATGLGARLDTGLSLLPFALATSAAACVTFGTLPALRLSRHGIRAGLQRQSKALRFRMTAYTARDAVVFGEVAAAVGLFTWSAMLYTLFWQVNAIRFAFPADHVVAMRVGAGRAPEVAGRVAAVPGVARTTLASGMLGGGARVRLESGGAIAAGSLVPVDRDFLDTLGVPLVAGRRFDSAEITGHAHVAILSETTARQLAPAGSALGMRVRIGEANDVTVVGICRDAIDYGALSRIGLFAPTDVYVPLTPAGDETVVLARIVGDAHQSLAAVAAVAQPPAGQRPVRPVILSDEFTSRAGGDTMTAVRLLAAFTLVTLLLAVTGVFAVVSQSVSERTREFGIHLALGALPRNLVAAVVAREAKLLVAAIATAVIFTTALTRALFAELVQINAAVPSLWAGSILAALCVAAAALLIATRRIVRLEPAAVLRRE